MGQIPPSPTPHLHRPIHLVHHLAPHDVPTRPLRSIRILHPTHFSISRQSRFPPIFPPKTQTLHLYVGLPCPWAHRTLIVRALKGLEDAVPVPIASPGLDGSWEFKDTTIPDKDRLVPGLDSANGCKTLREVYKLRRGGYDGRSTVPMLWDSERKEVVCNESYDIIEVFNSGLNGLARNSDLDLSPPSLKKEIDEWNRIIYPSINNGVYR